MAKRDDPMQKIKLDRPFFSFPFVPAKGEEGLRTRADLSTSARRFHFHLLVLPSLPPFSFCYALLHSERRFMAIAIAIGPPASFNLFSAATPSWSPPAEPDEQ